MNYLKIKIVTLISFIIIMVTVKYKSNANVTINIDPAAWFTAAQVNGLVANGGAVGVDIDNDGDVDVMVNYTNSNNGVGTKTVTAGVANGRIRFDNTLGNQPQGTLSAATLDYSFTNGLLNNNPDHYRIDFSTLTDIDMSSANGATVGYEFGIMDIYGHPGGVPTVNDAFITANYNTALYNGAASTGLIHDQLYGLPGNGLNTGIPGTAFFTMPTTVAGGSGTGVGSALQHYGASGIGNNIWDVYTAAPGIQNLGGFSFTSGIAAVNPGFTTTGAASTAGGGTVVVNPEPSSALLVMLGASIFALRRTRKH